MKLDIQTIALVSCLIFLTQFIGLFVQYIVNRTNRGIKWWLLGSFLFALGVIFMPLVTFPSLEKLARIANPLFVLGQIILYIGLMRFVNKKENRGVLGLIFVIFLLFYYYFMFVKNDISGRTIVGTAALTVISFITTFRLVFNKARHISGSTNFTAMVFFAYGIFSAIRFFWALISPSMQTYSDQRSFLELSFIVPIIASSLWTFGFIIMVNQRLNGEIREEKEKLQLLFNTSPDAAVISRLTDGCIIDVNAGFTAMSGYTQAELIGNSTIRINIWHKPEDRESFIKQLEAKGICENTEFLFQRKDGSLLTGSVSGKIIPILNIPHVFTVVHDITQSKLNEEAIRESEELYRSILNASPDDITITDLQGRIQVISPAAKNMFGYETAYDHFVGSQLLDFIVPDDRERAKSNITRMFKGDYSGPNEYHAVRKDQSIFDIEVNSGLINNANGQPARMVFVVRDITGRKQAEQQIQELVQQLEIEKKAAELRANTDSLTGLANRRYFDEALNKEFHRLKRSGSMMSLIMLDVDHFKKYNDCYGHLAGDDCLRQIGTTLGSFVGRVTDTVARYGGEEFVAVLTETDQHGAEILAERIRKAVEALAIPHSGTDISEYVTVSLGVVTVYPNRVASPDLIVALADEALYRAKSGGRNRFAVSDGKAIPDNDPAE